MAKKKQEEEVIEEKPQEEAPQPEIDYKNIHESDTSELAKQEPPKEEVKPEEVSPEPKKTEKPTEEPKPEFNLEEHSKKVAEETAKKTREEIADLLKGENKEETRTNKDEYRDWAERFQQVYGKAPEYTDAFEFLEDRAFKRLEEKQQKAYEQAQEEQKKQAEQEKTYSEQFSTMLDEEVKELIQAGKLPRPKGDWNDDTDPAVQERRALMGTMLKVNNQRMQEGKPIIYSVSRIHANYHKPLRSQPAGANAPIGGGRASGANANSEGEIDYMRDVKGKSFRQIIGEMNPFKK